MISFEPLWETMKKKGISQYKLIKEYKISTGQLDRLRKNGNVSTYTLDQLCRILTVGWKMWLPTTLTRRQSCKARIINNEKARFDG